MTKKIENNDIIHLQNAHVSQFTTGPNKTNWLVRKNISSENLAELPGYLSEADVFAILDFARKFELIAFNEGIAFGKKKTITVYEPTIRDLQMKLELATQENERLAEILQKHIGE